MAPNVLEAAPAVDGYHQQQTGAVDVSKIFYFHRYLWPRIYNLNLVRYGLIPLDGAMGAVKYSGGAPSNPNRL